jgi:hypothetical protein
MKNDFITITLSNGETQSFALDIKELELKDNSSIENLEAFIPLQNLEKIILINCEKLNDLSAIGSFKKLRVLSLYIPVILTTQFQFKVTTTFQFKLTT